MPVYGKEKYLQMSRSILPSSGRKRAKKEKDKLHRFNRRRINMSLNSLKGYIDDVDNDYLDSDDNYYLDMQPHRDSIFDGYDDIVYRRRDSDKLHHFEWWAYRKTLNMRPVDKLPFIKSVLPSGLLSFHAMSHLRFLEPDYPNQTYFTKVPYRLTRSYKSPYYKQMNQLRKTVFDAVFAVSRDPKLIKEFNKYLIKNAKTDYLSTVKRIPDDGRVITDWTRFRRSNGFIIESVKTPFYEVRTLRGYHDVYKFVRDIFDAVKFTEKLGYHPSWLDNVKAYFKL